MKGATAMALTANGNRTGMAAVTDRRDTREYLYTEQRKQAAQNRRLSKLVELLQMKLIEIEGADSFSAWWFSDQVPDDAAWQVHIRMLEERLRATARKLI
jgi:hypothetical protein